MQELETKAQSHEDAIDITAFSAIFSSLLEAKGKSDPSQVLTQMYFGAIAKMTPAPTVQEVWTAFEKILENGSFPSSGEIKQLIRDERNRNQHALPAADSSTTATASPAIARSGRVTVLRCILETQGVTPFYRAMLNGSGVLGEIVGRASGSTEPITHEEVLAALALKKPDHEFLKTVQFVEPEPEPEPEENSEEVLEESPEEIPYSPVPAPNLGSVCVVNLRAERSAIKQPGFVYIGRQSDRLSLHASPLQNPFRMGVDGDRDDVCDAYEEEVLEPAIASRKGEVWNELNLLSRRVLQGESLILGCFCEPERCHGHSVARAIASIVLSVAGELENA